MVDYHWIYFITFPGDNIKKELNEFGQLNNPVGSSFFSSVDIDAIAFTTTKLFYQILLVDTGREFLDDLYFQQFHPDETIFLINCIGILCNQNYIKVHFHEILNDISVSRKYNYRLIKN